MKKAHFTLIIIIQFIVLVSCGGKDMNGTADYSNRGPDYFDPDYHTRTDTFSERTAGSMHESGSSEEPGPDSPGDKKENTNGSE